MNPKFVVLVPYIGNDFSEIATNNNFGYEKPYLSIDPTKEGLSINKFIKVNSDNLKFTNSQIERFSCIIFLIQVRF